MTATKEVYFTYGYNGGNFKTIEEAKGYVKEHNHNDYITMHYTGTKNACTVARYGYGRFGDRECKWRNV